MAGLNDQTFHRVVVSCSWVFSLQT